MKQLVSLISFLILFGCSDSLVLSHHNTLPVLNLPEQGDPVKAKSFTFAGEVSYLHEEEFVIPLEDSLTIPGIENYDPEQSSSDVIIRYYPRLQASGKWGFNPSRYFTIGFRGSFGTLHTTPDIVAKNMDSFSGTMGLWMRVGGPLAGNNNISIVGSTSHLVGFTPSFYRTFSVSSDKTASESNELETSFLVEQSVAIQFRPRNKFGLFFGYAHMPFNSEFLTSSLYDYTGLGYGGFSIPLNEIYSVSFRGGVQFSSELFDNGSMIQPRFSLQWSSNRPVH